MLGEIISEGFNPEALRQMLAELPGGCSLVVMPFADPDSRYSYMDPDGDLHEPGLELGVDLPHNPPHFAVGT